MMTIVNWHAGLKIKETESQPVGKMNQEVDFRDKAIHVCSFQRGAG